MRTKSVKKNYVYNLIYEIFSLIVPLITTPYVSRVIGAEGVGLYSFTHTNAMYFALFAALGTTVYARREVAYKQESIIERSTVFWEIIVLRVAMTIIGLMFYGLYVIVFTDNILIGAIQSFYIFIVMVDITWLFQGMEDFGTIVIRGCIIKIVNVIFIFVFVNSSDDVIAYIFGLAFLPLLAHLITWGCIRKYICLINIKKLRPLRHLKGAVSLFIPTIAAQVYLMLDKTMIGAFTVDNVENGYYEQAQKIIRICWTVVTTLATVMSPRIASSFAKNDKIQLQRYMRKSFIFVWFASSAISFGLCGIVANMVPWFFGEGFEKVSVLLMIFSWLVFPVGMYSVTGSQYLVTTKRQLPYTISIISGAFVNLILNLVLIPHFFSIGAAIASLIAELIIALVQIIYLTMIIKEISIFDVLYNSWRYIISGMSMFMVVKILSDWLIPNIVNTSIIIAIGATIYIGMLLLLRDPLVTEYSKKFFGKLGKLLSKKKSLK